MAPRRPRGPTDPERAARISKATFEVVRDRGIAGLTHRAVATQAEVPLGSTTYHYTDRNDLIASAMIDAIAENERLTMNWAKDLTPENAVRRLSALLARQTKTVTSRRRLLVEYELYLAAARADHLRPLSRRWDAVLRTVLENRVGQAAGRAYFAVYNGLILESLIGETALAESDVEEVLAAVSDGWSPLGLPVPDTRDG